jgi:nicotinate-nucleotide--dimethylbenzimidazole phosphoribosyltransferase
MHSSVLNAAKAKTQPIDKNLEPRARKHLDNLTKPPGSLGRLEDLATQLYCLQGGHGPTVSPARLFVCAGDHGVTAQGVSAFPQEVTRQMVLNFLAGGAGVNVMARTADIEVTVVNAGCLGGGFDTQAENFIDTPAAQGTADFTQAPAMSAETCEAALQLGWDLAQEAADEGIRCLLTGDMGIGNTTPSAALYCALLNLDAKAVVGPGTGLDDAGIAHKVQVVEAGLTRHKDIVASGDAFRILAALGGLEIACLAGLILGARSRKIATIVDGYISGAAYAAAFKMLPLVAEGCVMSHASAEPGHALVMEALEAKPLLDLGMRLGEGTGAVLAHNVLRQACACFNEMASFAEAGVSEKEG